MSDSIKAERAAWGDFPAVIRNGDLGSLKNEPEYMAAKKGDMSAAIDLVEKLLTDDTVSKIKETIGDSKSLLLPVMAVEEAGNNKIPLAFAVVLADRLGLDVDTDIFQREKVSRTNSGSGHRLAFNPTFTGNVKKDQPYLILDDTCTTGGTLASLRGYVENRGGKVLAATVMTAHVGAIELVVKPKMLAAIDRKHGPEMNEFWKEEFGFGIDKVTQGEAGHLKSAASVDVMRTRIATARNEAGLLLGNRGNEASQGPSQSDNLRGSGEKLSGEAETLEREQQVLLENAPGGQSSVVQSYGAALETYVEEKHNQVERLEDKLEGLLEQQQARLQQTRSNQPGIFSMLGEKAAWQAQQNQQQARIQSLQARLETVREIKDGMSVHGPKVDELATRKLRAKEPELAADFDEYQEAQRRHQAHLRKKEMEEKRQQQGQGRGQRQGLRCNP
ncbi:hypothetical protein IQ22_04697 [Pseudomonas duriflava]|uniref:Uncharacterized protein n=1 Tax=Pseudomonas duriflava TaxID=459528 RepID=A0A562PJP1_9PSED|nr:phosphoribosyltransferase [Pseudomonas duriflava]TWI44682.1 hypothetical protein IQ22_04697 [Pseudomonas duriflava]